MVRPGARRVAQRRLVGLSPGGVFDRSGAVTSDDLGSGRKIKVVGFDATDDAVAAVKAGTLSATVAQQPAVIGSLGIDTVKSVLAGKSVPKFVPVALQLITR